MRSDRTALNSRTHDARHWLPITLVFPPSPILEPFLNIGFYSFPSSVWGEKKFCQRFAFSPCLLRGMRRGYLVLALAMQATNAKPQMCRMHKVFRLGRCFEIWWWSNHSQICLISKWEWHAVFHTKISNHDLRQQCQRFHREEKKSFVGGQISQEIWLWVAASSENSNAMKFVVPCK